MYEKLDPPTKVAYCSKLEELYPNCPDYSKELKIENNVRNVSKEISVYSSVLSSVLKTVDRQIVSLLPQAKNICLLVGILNPGGLICSNRFLKLVDWTVSNLMEPKDL